MKRTDWKSKSLLFTCMFLIQTLCCFSQVKNEKLSVYLMEDKDLTLYQGIANDVNLLVSKVADPCDSVPIRIFIPNGEVQRVRGERYKVIINTSPATATIYAETPEGLVKAGTITFRGVELPDTTDGNFRSEMVRIQYHVDKNENFDPTGKNIPDHSTRYFLPTWRAPLLDLYSDAAKNVWVRVMKLIDENTGCVISPNLSLESADAIFTKIPGKRNTFSVSPKPGVKKCNINVFMNEKGKKTLLHAAELRVRKKPKDDY